MLKLVTAAASTPVSLADLKDHLAIDGTDHDTRLTALLAAATAFCESETNRAFVSQTWDSIICSFPCGSRHRIELPKPPLISVSSIVYYDESNVQQTWNSANYRVHTPTTVNGYIELADPYGTWPTTYERDDAVTIRFVCGYASQPPEVCHAIKLLCGAWNELREGEITTTSKQTELGVQRLLGHLVSYRYV